MWKWKGFDPASWAAFLSSLKWLKEAADENSSAVSGLGEDFATLTQLTTKEVAAKQDKPRATPFSIPATGWAKDEDTKYPNYYDLTVTGVTANDRVEIELDRDSQVEAWNCGLSTLCESLGGKVRLRATEVPSKALAGEYWAEQGKE